MKRFNYRRHYRRQMLRDTFILVAPIILTVVAILWSLKEQWIYSRLRHVLMSFVDSFLSHFM
jgi:hypothetical protein